MLALLSPFSTAPRGSENEFLFFSRGMFSFLEQKGGRLFSSHGGSAVRAARENGVGPATRRAALHACRGSDFPEAACLPAAWLHLCLAPVRGRVRVCLRSLTYLSWRAPQRCWAVAGYAGLLQDKPTASVCNSAFLKLADVFEKTPDNVLR